MTSYFDYTFFWGTQTPAGMAGISTNGPSNVPFACTPVYSAQYFTFTWYQLGNGCPVEYSWNAASTCISTAGVYNTMSWGCTWTTSVAATSTIDGGTTTVSAGQAATAIAPVVWVTITNTQQTTSTTTSTVDPGAKTVTVTSTPGVSKRDDNFAGALFPARNYGTDMQRVVEPGNATSEVLDSRAVCASNDINCGLNCCLSDQTCIAGGTYPCCNGWACVPYNPYEPFTGNIYWSWQGYTATSTSWAYQTTYFTVNPPGSTVTITPTSTSAINFVQTQIVTATITTSDPTVTIVSVLPATTLITGFTGAGGVTKTGGPGSSESITSVSTSGGTVVTISGSTFTTGGTPVTVVLPPSTSTNSGSPPVTSSSTNNGLVVKVAAGVGTPLGLCLFGLLIFCIFRYRKRNKDKKPKPAPPNIISSNFGGDSAMVESSTGGDASAYHTTANVASKPLRPATVVENSPSDSQGFGYGDVPMSPTSQHSQQSEMFAPAHHSSEIYTHPPRYASPPRYVGDENHGYYVNEAETVANRHEL
ncbi:uncharacterized protein LY89DRAFT_788007 [Mollisia scopiformis]|uniref:Uncharacterized protein n=1 Tax=Mollisia scopiformis TaxID=149040 RepID=A0A132BBE0_MOLSC|nr:uncharacterized protein LY89DRAFT_788007 [Mollisia scopiformis]KUJ09742.1 hypothetical protein LY89DRAFT_788007 [Mollisia scopiformis]